MSGTSVVFAGKSKTSLEEQFEREVGAYEALWPQLRQSYLGEWVAIKNGRLIDADSDRRSLIARVRGQFPGEVVYFEKVLPDQPHRLVDIPGIDSA